MIGLRLGQIPHLDRRPGQEVVNGLTGRRQQPKEFAVNRRSDLVQPVERMQRADRQIGLGGLDQHGEFDL